MGKKINPKIFRIPSLRSWQSNWFARSHYFKKFLEEDIKIRKYLNKKLKNTGLAEINIERIGQTIKITIRTAKPGLIIGRGGVDVEKLKKTIQEKFLSKDTALELNILEVSSPNQEAKIIVDEIINDLEKRIPYRKTMKRAISLVQKSGAKGVKVVISGRLDGKEIARSEKLIWGKLPLHTLRADIDYNRSAAQTLYGLVGVKVWIYKGEIFRDSSKIQTQVKNF